MIKPQFTRKDIHDYLKEKQRRIEEAIIRRLKYLGEACVNEGRTNHTYTDQTGNLTSSIGYGIFAGNQLIHENLTSIMNGQVGMNKAREFIRSYRKSPNQFTLIVVAGMDYAFKVASKGYNVLDSAETKAINELPRLLRQLRQNIEQI